MVKRALSCAETLRLDKQIDCIVNEDMKQILKGRFLFLTLTLKNIRGGKLTVTLFRIKAGINRLFKYKKV